MYFVELYEIALYIEKEKMKQKVDTENRRLFRSIHKNKIK